MNLNFRPLIFLLVASPLLVQCVPTGQDITTLDLRVRNLDNRLLTVDKQMRRIEESVSRNDQIDQIQSKQAELSDSLDRLNMEFLQIKGQLEENDHFYRNTSEEIKQTKESLNKQVADLADQIMLLADQMNQTAANINSVQESSEAAINKAKAAEERAREVEQSAATAIAEAERKAAQAAAAAAEAVAAAEARAAQAAKVEKRSNHKPELTPGSIKVKYEKGKKVTVAVAEPEPQEEDAKGLGPGKEIYDKALDLFRASKFNQAYRVFADYLEQFPKGKMAPNARFWLGDCYYNQQEYELAILEYQKVIAEHGRHAKAPAALLKQGLAFEKLKDNETAKIVYRKLQEEYPNSEQVAIAQKRMEAL